MTEKMRTIILFALLFIAIGFIWWMNSNYAANFTDQLGEEVESATVEEQAPAEDANTEASDFEPDTQEPEV